MQQQSSAAASSWHAAAEADDSRSTTDAVQDVFPFSYRIYDSGRGDKAMRINATRFSFALNR